MFTLSRRAAPNEFGLPSVMMSDMNMSLRDGFGALIASKMPATSTPTSVPLALALTAASPGSTAKASDSHQDDSSNVPARTATMEGIVFSVAQSVSLVLAVSRDHYLRAWSKKDGALVFKMRTPLNQKACTVAVQGRLAAFGTGGGYIFLVDLSSATVLHSIQGHKYTVRSVIFNGDEIISGGGMRDRTICVWNKVSGRETLRIDMKVVARNRSATVMSLAAHGNLLVAGLDDETMRIFDRVSGDPRHTLTEAAGPVCGVAIDAQRLVSGSYDKKVRVYVVPSFELVYTLEGHTDGVRSVALEDDLIVSGSTDKTVRVWDARSGAILRVLRGHSESVFSVSLCGSEIVSGCLDSKVHVWDADSGSLKHVLNGTETVRPIADDLGPMIEIGGTEEAKVTSREQLNLDRCDFSCLIL
ncbi:WD repeat-containing protein wdr-5.1 [Hondaea fermentalgiana]|uniref:WD repeat-containing protein wdr-5.1 n=1 Tax=Hondaea fermentalgiana TaxID=2315210 RepID=A0A2R5GEU5_9STRA|nr:WD repeat-containing protein wdr-5.1 [Hondaea fermentalgiana]|eukprot:GBG26354.1 WD repeat-containing protein wdr-5.1 [Hondaea fermentalgiana]